MPIPVILAAVILFLLLAVLIVCACLARYLVYPPRPSFRDTYRLEAAMRYLRDYDETESEYYTVPSFDGYELHAELIRAYQPSDKYVIISHGYSYDRHGSIKYVHLYRANGYNCIIYDSRGHGLNKKAPCAFGVTECRDLRALIDDCCSRFGAGIFLGLHGESMGSALSALCLGEKPPVRFAMLDCGYADFRSVIEGKLKGFHAPRFLVYPIEWMCRLWFRVSIFAARPADALRGNDVPLCLIHGENDGLIPVSHASRLKEANKGYCEVHTFPGADHAQSFLTDEARYLRILTAFLHRVETRQEVTQNE
ncbi:MAG: alpha/beta fold hydrolase [Clostridia bacterium]|nr:alpha/beta fold hydrolase [Clostridia bacterium]